MKHTTRILLSLCTVLALLLSAVTPVFAEDAPPPPPAVNPDGSGGAVKEAGQSGEGISEDGAEEAAEPVADTPDPNYVSQPNYDPGGAATSGLGTFQGEELIDTTGNAVAEGTDLAALATGSAYACPPGTLPVFLGGACNNVFNTSSSIYAAQNAIDFALPGWTIWLTPYFDGDDIYNLNKPLTIQGSSNGSAFVGGVGGSDSITIFSGNVTLRDVLARGRIFSSGYGGTLRLQNVFVYSPLSYGVFIDDNYGSVILSQVNVTGSKYGSHVDVNAGTGTVTIANSVFNGTQTWDPGDPGGEGGKGLSIVSKNTVKMENVSASDNYSDGLYVVFAKGLSIKNGVFINNAYGIYASDQGATPAPVLFQNVLARVNDGDGIHLENAGATTVLNSIFESNFMDGLHLSMGRIGTILLDGIVGSGNSSFGANINVLGSVTVSVSRFTGNHDGLSVSTLGAVNLKGVQAAWNYSGRGAYIMNNYTGTTQGVNVLGGYYDYNGYAGLEIYSHGSVTLNGVTVTYNNFTGGDKAVMIDNCDYYSGACHGIGNVTFSNTQGPNNILYNFRGGVDIYSRGTVSLNTVFANDNSLTGIHINNYDGWGT
jgi:hypothetical protein